MLSRIKLFMWGAGLLFAVSHAGRPAVFAADQAEAEKNKEPAAKILFEKLSHDFGTALQNSTLKYTFKFKNVGNGQLIIEKVKAG